MVKLDIALEICPEALSKRLRKSMMGTFNAHEAYRSVRLQLDDYPRKVQSYTQMELDQLQSMLISSFQNGFNQNLSNVAIQNVIMHRIEIVGLDTFGYV